MKPWKIRETYLGEVVRPPEARTARGHTNAFVPRQERWALDDANKQKKKQQQEMQRITKSMSTEAHTYDF